MTHAAMPTAERRTVTAPPPRDDQAAADLLDAVTPFVRKLARHAARRVHADADDLAQEFLFDIWKNAHRFDPARGKPQKFAFLRCSKVLGSRFWKRWARVAVIDPDAVPWRRTGNRFPNPLHAAELAEDVTRLRAAVVLLPTQARRAVVVRFGLDGRGERSPAEVCRAIRTKKSAGQAAVNRGLMMLADAMGADPRAARVSRKAALGAVAWARTSAGRPPVAEAAVRARGGVGTRAVSR